MRYLLLTHFAHNSKGGETIGRFVTLFKPVSNWIVSPVGDDIIHSKTGAVIGNRNTRMIYSIIIPCVLRFAFFPLIIFSVNNHCLAIRHLVGLDL